MDSLEAFGAVAFVLALLTAVLFALKKRGIAGFAPLGNKNRIREMELLERLPLGAQHCLHLVRIGDEKCLVTTSPGACHVQVMQDRSNL